MRRRPLGWLLATMVVATCGSATPTTPGTSPPTNGSVVSASAVTPSRPSALPSGPAAAAGRIAYVLGRGGQDELHVVNADGSDDRSCGVGSMPAWTPDGAAIVYAGPESINADGFAFPDLYRASADCGDVVMILKEGTAPHVSPDGSWITFGRGVIDMGEAWLTGADVTNPRALTAGTSPTWSPDGSWLLFNPDTGAFELGLMRPDGSGYRSLGLGYHPAWTPDGRILYLHNDDGSGTTTIRAIALDGAATDLLATTSDVAWPLMSADGRVVFVLDGDLWRLDPGATAAVPVTNGIGVSARPSASSDDRWLSAVIGGADPGLAIVSIDGGWVRLLDGAVTEVAWQPVSP